MTEFADLIYSHCILYGLFQVTIQNKTMAIMEKCYKYIFTLYTRNIFKLNVSNLLQIKKLCIKRSNKVFCIKQALKQDLSSDNGKLWNTFYVKTLFTFYTWKNIKYFSDTETEMNSWGELEEWVERSNLYSAILIPAVLNVLTDDVVTCETLSWLLGLD